MELKPAAYPALTFSRAARSTQSAYLVRVPRDSARQDQSSGAAGALHRLARAYAQAAALQARMDQVGLEALMGSAYDPDDYDRLILACRTAWREVAAAALAAGVRPGTPN